jgi:hypothetical protein
METSLLTTGGLRFIETISLGGIGLGIILWLIAMRYVNRENPPRLILLPSQWLPVWRMKDHFVRKGFALYLTGTILVVAAVLLGLVARLATH